MHPPSTRQRQQEGALQRLLPKQEQQAAQAWRPKRTRVPLKAAWQRASSGSAGAVPALPTGCRSAFCTAGAGQQGAAQRCAGQLPRFVHPKNAQCKKASAAGSPTRHAQTAPSTRASRAVALPETAAMARRRRRAGRSAGLQPSVRRARGSQGRQSWRPPTLPGDAAVLVDGAGQRLAQVAAGCGQAGREPSKRGSLLCCLKLEHALQGLPQLAGAGSLGAGEGQAAVVPCRPQRL